MDKYYRLTAQTSITLQFIPRGYGRRQYTRKLSRQWVNPLEGATIGIPMEEHTDYFFRPSQHEWEEKCKLDWEFACSYFCNQASLTFGIKKRTKAGYIVEGVVVEQGRNYLVTIKKNVIVWKPLYNCKIVYVSRKERKLW